VRRRFFVLWLRLDDDFFPCGSYRDHLKADAQMKWFFFPAGCFNQKLFLSLKSPPFLRIFCVGHLFGELSTKTVRVGVMKRLQKHLNLPCGKAASGGSGAYGGRLEGVV